MKKSMLLGSLVNRKGKCKFTDTCSLYSNASYTCTHTGGSYCGRYRKLSRKPMQNEEAQIEYTIIA